jgi:hypothetical protein
MALVINGAVMMKMTTKTSMTSTNGVMLMSLMGFELWVRSRRPKLMLACLMTLHQLT